MNANIHQGLTATRQVTVDRDRTIGFMGEDLRVYATPALVADIEMACRNLLVENLPEGQDSVGVTVSIAHLAPTLLGMEATITVTVTEVDGNKITFGIEARDPVETICKGNHQRFIVDLDITRERLRKKAEKAGMQ